MRSEFLRERGDRRAIRIKQGGDMKAAILQAARHVRAHPSDTNKTDIHDLLSLDLSCKKWVLALLFAHRRERAMAGTKDRLVRQGQDFLKLLRSASS